MATSFVLFGIFFFFVQGAAFANGAVGGTWTPLGDLEGTLPGGRGAVKAIVVYEGSIVAGGAIRARATGGAHVARWSGEAWEALGGGANKPVDALAVFEGALFAGGSFDSAGVALASRVARWNGSAWSHAGEGFDGWVPALTVHDGRLFAGGEFSHSGSTPIRNVAMWGGEAWLPLADGIGAAPDTARERPNARADAVRVLGSFRGELVAGGIFREAGSVAAANLASWDGVRWKPLGAGVDGEVLALAELGGSLFAGGSFTQAGGTKAPYLARWDGSSWHAVEGTPSRWVSALAPLEGVRAGGELLVGGCFLRVGALDAPFLAAWNGSSWRALDAGFDHCVEEILVDGARLYAGGSFTTAGGIPGHFLAHRAPE